MQEIKDLREKGASTDYIMKRLGLSRATVCRYAAPLDIRENTALSFGDKVALLRSKFYTDEQISQILQVPQRDFLAESKKPAIRVQALLDLQNGASSQTVMERYGVPQGRLYNWVYQVQIGEWGHPDLDVNSSCFRKGLLVKEFK